LFKEKDIMWQRSKQEFPEEEVFLAGETVRPGVYRQLDGGREIRLEKEDTLPASLDGHVACYTLVTQTWADISSRSSARA
jgi:hypothetical protein